MTAKLWGLLAGLALLVGIAGSLYAWGRHDGREVQRKEDARELERKSSALITAAGALSAASSKFREIDAATKDSREQGERVKAEASKAAREAERQRDALAARLDQINRADKQEKTTCTQAQARVCGSPLR